VVGGEGGGVEFHCTIVCELQEIWHVQCLGIPPEVKQASVKFS
jgi:hypothetical protein